MSLAAVLLAADAPKAGLAVGETIRSWSVMETIISVRGLIGVLILNAVV